MQKMLYDRPYGSWQKKSGRITLHIGWKKIAYKYGHETVRLPPYHCQLNPIELIWGIEKKKKTMWHQKIKNINFQKLKTYSGRKEKK